VNFGEPVAEGIWNLAEENAKQADLMLVFGSSLKVRPAMDLPTLSSTYHIRFLTM
jgi:NAD-dependent SIR2 family protein deacetylase